MEKGLSPTRGDRILRLFHRHAVRAREIGLSRQLIEDERLEGDSILLGGQRLANFALCSYLGLGDHGTLKEGARRAIDRYGTSYSSSVAYTSLPLYGELEELMEAMMEAHVVLAPTTTLAHLAALPVLVRPGDQVLVDTLAHGSVQTATQMLQVNDIPVHTLPHNDMEAADRALAASDGSGRTWMLVDGVYSMHGDLAPARELIDLLDRHPHLHLYVDDAHGFGWSGEHGRGAFLGEHGWHERMVVAAGLSKSFGATGGIVATRNEELAELVELCGPPLTFGGPIPPAALGAAVASARLHLSPELAGLQEELASRIDLVNEIASERGIPLTSLAHSPIWYLAVGEYERMVALFLRLREDGFFVNGSAFPAVPHGHAGIRFTVTRYNSAQQIEAMLESLLRHTMELVGDTALIVDLEEERSPREQHRSS